MIQTGKTLAHYEILEKIGTGGMGEVWKARDTTLNREVAIKVLPEIFAQDEERRGRFEREARLLAQLNHPGIAAVHGLHEEDGVHFLAMELVPGQDLHLRLERGPLPVDEALKVASRVAEALEAAHEQGVVHRDLKPSNIVLMPGGAAKVLDFGLAKSMDAARGDSDLSASPTLTTPGTMEGVILGTAAYMSPEQARGKPVDKRTDIWAFGCVLYECLTGTALFKGETVSDTIGAILHKEPEWNSLPQETPPTVTLLLKRCLTRDPEQRLRDIGDARIEIGAALGDPSGSYLGLPPAGVSVASPGPGKPSALILAVICGLIGIALGASLISVLRSGTESIPLRKLDLGVSIENPSSGDAMASISPDGTKVVFTHDERLWVQFLNELTPRVIEDSEEALAPFWSSDGSQIGFFKGTRLWRVAATGGRPVRIAEVGQIASGGYGATWGQDNQIVYSRGNAGLFSVSGLGGEPRELLPLESGDQDFHEPQLLPDGEGVVFVVHPQGGTPSILVAARDGVRHELLRGEGGSFKRPVYSPEGYILFERSGGATQGLWAIPFDASTLSPAGEAFLIFPDATSPSVSQDGALVFVSGIIYRAGNEQLQWVDRTGEVLETEGGARNLGNDLALSPNGRYLAFGTVDEESNQFDLWVRDLERATETRITNDEDSEFNFRWTPDGKEILFTNWRSGVRTGELKTYATSADGSSSPVEVCPGIIESLSPDGEWMIVARFDAPDTAAVSDSIPRQFYRVPRNEFADSEPVLAGTDNSARHGTLSPDGRFLLYTSRASGHGEIFLTRYPDGTGRWQVSTNGGDFAQWDPRGDRLYYLEKTKLMEVPIQTDSGSVTLGQPSPHFDIPSHDFTLSQDGDRFLIVGSPQEENPDLAPRVGVKLVTNWITEFKTD